VPVNAELVNVYDRSVVIDAKTGRPRPAEAMNAQLPNDRAIEDDLAGDGDVVLVGRCVSREEYARTQEGDWIAGWYIVRIEMISVEKGEWDKPMGPDTDDGPAAVGLSFVERDEWPTPESGILTSPRFWPYEPGNVLVFTLDTRTAPARIVGQEFRGSE